MIKSFSPYLIVGIACFIMGLMIDTSCEREPDCPQCPEIEIVNKEVFPEKPKVEVKEPEVKEPVKEEPVRQVSITPKSRELESLQKSYDSLVQVYNALSTYRDYVDSIRFENLIVTYNLQAEGYLRDIDIGIIDNRPKLIETREIRFPPEIKYANGLFIGASIGGSQHQFNNLSPVIFYVNQKNVFGYGYNVLEGTHNATVGRKVF